MYNRGEKETAEDEAVNKVIEKAAVDAAARTAAQGGVLPEVEMREGEQQFAAAASSGVSTTKRKEPVTTEADVVAPAHGVGAGDRVVDAKMEKKPKKAKASPAKTKAAKKVGLLSFISIRLSRKVYDTWQARTSNAAAWNVLMVAKST